MPTQSPSHPPIRLRLAALLGSLGLLVSLLALDLRARGLVWQFFWSQTGEESPGAQVRGMIELGGNLLRQPPDLAPFVPIAHTADTPFGINVFLQKEVEEPKMRAMLQMMRAAGFTWLRQEFPWEDLEVDGRGQFTDSRIDYSGDGVPDTVDAWAKYDRLVALAEEYDFKLLVRLSNPPYWAQADQTDSLAASLAPPQDVQDFVNFAVAVAERYRGRLHYYQVWNEPNIYPEWGEAFADPVAYTTMLCRTYAALKAVDPAIVVVAAALAPTIALDAYNGYQDVVYLERMYQAGAGACFDILAAQGYGLFSGPPDQRLRLTSVTAARHMYLRDLMVAHGDAAKPIWISEAAWNAVLDAERPPDQIRDFERFGLATRAEAARYMPLYYERAAQEWPYIGNIFYWFFTRPDPFEADQSFYYFRMVEPDYQPDKPTFTPLPVYDSMKAYLTRVQANPVLYAGVHQAESWEIQAEGTLQPAAGAQFGTALAIRQLTAQVYGTDVLVRWQEAGADWRTTHLTLGDAATTAQVTILSADAGAICPAAACIQGAGSVTVDSLSIFDHSARRRLPVLLVGAAWGLLALGVIGAALWRRATRRRESRHA